MSLASRVQDAGGATTAPAASAPGGYESLKAQVIGMVSADRIAALAKSSPAQARSELKGACRIVLEGPAWVLSGAKEREELTGRLLDEVLGFGPLEGLLADGEVTEIMVNGPYDIFCERRGVLYPTGCAFADEAHMRSVIDRILGPLGRRVDELTPMVDARLPEGHRVNVVLPPLAPDGPLITIRKFPERTLSLADMQGSGSMDVYVRAFLTWAVRLRKSIAVSGGTGSGKTTLLNALSCEISPAERIVTIEDSAELRFDEHPHVVRLEARPGSSEGVGEVTIRDLVRNALRMRPDRIVVGECRGGEALDMLQAMLTGHDGSMTTLHANSPADAVQRLTTMVRFAVDLPVDVIHRNIASAFDVVVQIARSPDGRRYVQAIGEAAFDEGSRSCVVRPLYQRKDASRKGLWLGAPPWLSECALEGIASEREVTSWRRCLPCAA